MDEHDQDAAGEKPGRRTPLPGDQAGSDGAGADAAPGPHPDSERPTGQAGTGQSDGAAPEPRR